MPSPRHSSEDLTQDEDEDFEIPEENEDNRAFVEDDDEFVSDDEYKEDEEDEDGEDEASDTRMSDGDSNDSSEDSEREEDPMDLDITIDDQY